MDCWPWTSKVLFAGVHWQMSIILEKVDRYFRAQCICLLLCRQEFSLSLKYSRECVCYFVISINFPILEVHLISNYSVPSNSRYKMNGNENLTVLYNSTACVDVYGCEAKKHFF